MPEYEYRCKKCNQTFSIERSMNDSSTVSCSHCNSADLARIWNANFLSGNTKAGISAGASTQAAMCDSNPTKPKSCCPCG